MTTTHGKVTSILFDKTDISTWFNQVDLTDKADTAETSGFQQNDKTYVMGMDDASLSLSGRWQGGVNGPETLFRMAILNLQSPFVTMGFGMGLKGGNPCLFGQAETSSFGPSSTTKDVVGIKGDLQITGAVYDGWYAMDKQSIAATTTGLPTVDLGAAQTGRIAAVLHLLSNANTGNVNFVVQHSVNGTVWTDLVTFAQRAAGDVGAYLTAIGQGTINRYVRVRATLSGTGAVQALVAIGIN